MQRYDDLRLRRATETRIESVNRAKRTACVSNICSYVFLCLSAFKSRLNRLHGDLNKAMAGGRVRRTFRGPTQRIS